MRSGLLFVNGPIVSMPARLKPNHQRGRPGVCCERHYWLLNSKWSAEFFQYRHLSPSVKGQESEDLESTG